MCTFAEERPVIILYPLSPKIIIMNDCVLVFFYEMCKLIEEMSGHVCFLLPTDKPRVLKEITTIKNLERIVFSRKSPALGWGENIRMLSHVEAERNVGINKHSLWYKSVLLLPAPFLQETALNLKLVRRC